MHSICRSSEERKSISIRNVLLFFNCKSNVSIPLHFKDDKKIQMMENVSSIEWMYSINYKENYHYVNPQLAQIVGLYHVWRDI